MTAASAKEEWVATVTQLLTGIDTSLSSVNSILKDSSVTPSLVRLTNNLIQVTCALAPAGMCVVCCRPPGMIQLLWEFPPSPSDGFGYISGTFLGRWVSPYCVSIVIVCTGHTPVLEPASTFRHQAA